MVKLLIVKIKSRSLLAVLEKVHRGNAGYTEGTGAECAEIYGWRMADGGWRMADGGWRMADGRVLSLRRRGTTICGMAKGKANHPLKLNGQSWDKQQVLPIILARMETMDMTAACKMGYEDAEGRKFGLPTPSTINEWMLEDPQLAAACAHARKKRAAHLVEEGLRLVDQEPPKDSRGSVDRGHIRWTESRIKQRQWMAERLDPDQYGAKTQVDVHHHGSIDIAQVLHDARHRVIDGKAERITPAIDVPEDVGDLFD